MSNQPAFPYKDSSLQVEQRVRDLLNRMTLEEKSAQLSAAWFPEVAEDEKLSESKAQARIGNGIGQITGLASRSPYTPERVAQDVNSVQAFLVERTRLGIPAIFHDECCSGFMARNAATFPQAIGMASTWDPDLEQEMTSVIRSQMRLVGVRQGLAPVMDINRDPRWGRVEETFGEDPYLGASMSTAFVRGLQGEDLRLGVAATGKHFAGHGIPESGLNWAPVHVGKREFREVYLHPFEAAVKEAHLSSLMNAYHEIDGIPCAASHELLTEIPRGEWGFDGIVTADYNSVAMLAEYHKVAADKVEAARMALEAGLDVELPGTDCYGAPLLEAVRTGKLDAKVLDESVRRVLSLKIRLGLFEQPYADPARVGQFFGRPEQSALARRAAQESIVLLKNEGSLLPLRPDLGSIAVIGPNADAIRDMLGDYSYGVFTALLDGGDVPPEKSKYPGRFPPGMLSVVEAIRRAVSPRTSVRYSRGCGISDPSTEGFAEALVAAKESEVAVVVVGGKSGHLADCTCGELRDRADLGLLGVQEELVWAVLETGTPVVLVLVDGRPAAIPALAERVPAILEAWLPGQEGGPALADVLFGEFNPGGKLPISFPRSASQLPVFYGRKPSGGRSFNFEDYVDMSAKPLFPFGHGLSYTRFEYSDLLIQPAQVSPQDQVEIAVTVKNAGDRRGDEVVQLYLRDVVASVTRPVKELKGFRRVSLEPGASCRITFTLAAAQMAFYDRQMRYGIEPGKIEVMVGSSSEDIRLRGEFEITDEATEVKKVFFTQARVE